MKPKAKRFRTQKQQRKAAAEDATTASAPPAATDDGLGGKTFPPRKDADKPGANTPEAEAIKQTEDPLEGIKREGLTGRQLRMARRIAQKQGLKPSSDFDAVRLLRESGIDPFKRANVLELVVDEAEGDSKPTEQSKQLALPAAAASQAQVPSTHVVTEGERSADIMQIQQDIARRRRKRGMFLALRLLFFVAMPALVAGYYFFAIATPMYATKSQFIIQQAEGGGSGQLGGLFSGTGLATSQDSIAVQGYLQSRDAMLRLNEDEGFNQHFRADDIDPLQRLDPDSTVEAAYKLYKKNVRIGYDPSEGVIRMEVIAADPAISERFSKQLISYAEERVDQLTARLRSDQMTGADASRKEAEQKMIGAQERVVELQEQLGVLSPEGEAQSVLAQIQGLEEELIAERISLAQFKGNERPNQARVSASENKIAELRNLIAEKRDQLTSSAQGTASLARVTAELQVAQQDLAKRFEFLALAEAQFETARLEANRQVRYLSIGVSPIAPDEPTYPRAFENTLLAFLIFSGIYLMVSLTASILREQV